MMCARFLPCRVLGVEWRSCSKELVEDSVVGDVAYAGRVRGRRSEGQHVGEGEGSLPRSLCTAVVEPPEHLDDL